MRSGPRDGSEGEDEEEEGEEENAPVEDGG